MGFDIGKAVTRMLTPSQRQLDAISQIAPIALAAGGAIGGNAMLANVGTAFGGPGVSQGYAVLNQQEVQRQSAIINAQNRYVYGDGFDTNANPYATAASGASGGGISGDTLLILGLIAVGGVAAFTLL